MASDARQAYNALAKYFGLRAKDAFLNPLAKSTISTDKDNTAGALRRENLISQKFFLERFRPTGCVHFKFFQ